jgi:hypothetical protein
MTLLPDNGGQLLEEPEYFGGFSARQRTIAAVKVDTPTRNEHVRRANPKLRGCLKTDSGWIETYDLRRGW